jgi:hypothetical protein
MKPLLLAFLLPCSGFAQLAYDGFRLETGYSAGTGKKGALSTQSLNGPAGWAGNAWDISGPKGSDLFIFREDAALTFPAISYPGGGGVEISPSDGLLRTRGRNFSTPVVFAGKSAFYMSFLLKVDGPDCGGTAYATFENAGGNNLGLGAGIHEGNLILLTRTAKGDRVLQSIGPAAPGTTYYFIVKLSDNDADWKSTDDLEIWINPTDVSSEAKVSETAELHFQDAANHNASAEFALGRLMLYVENFIGAKVFFDEFAFGESLSEVAAPKVGQ